MAAADNGRTTGIAARLALLLAGALLVVGMRAAAGAGVGPVGVQALAGPELLSVRRPPSRRHSLSHL